MDDWLEVLKNEFPSGPGSFTLQLRIDLVWDKQAFSRMTAAMLECCKAYDHHKIGRQTTSDDPMEPDETPLPRWIAEGFWYYSWWVESWTKHPAWENTIAQDPEYYSAAYERLSDLAYWLFTGESLYLHPEKGYAPM